MRIRDIPALIALTLVCLLAPADMSARAETPSAVDLLFEGKHFAGLATDAQLKYSFERTPKNTEHLGAGFKDEIKLILGPAATSGARNVNLRVFTGKRGRDPVDLPDMAGNPIVVLFLDRAVNNFGILAGGARNYIKSRVRSGIRDASTVTREDAMFEGKKIEAYRIVMMPFANDPNQDRMSGYHNAKITVVASPEVPGRVLSVATVVESPLKNSPGLEERIELVASGAAK